MERDIVEEAMKAMALANVKVEDIAQDLRPFIVVYKDKNVQRFIGTDRVPPSLDAGTGVESQDVVIEEGGVWVRLYKPSGATDSGEGGKLPVLVYFHGGGFCLESAASPLYHNYLNKLCSEAKVVMVSVDYRRAPEYLLPTAYEDSWVALKWVENGHPWITEHGDTGRVYLAGDSAGGNIAHFLAKRIGKTKEKLNLNLKGILLIHPYFWGKDRIGTEEERFNNFPGGEMAGKVWELVSPESSSLDDPLINPGMDSDLGVVGGEKVMVCVAEKDPFRDRGLYYKEALIKNGFKSSSVEVVETLGEGHVFHLYNPESPNAGPFMNRVVTFLNSS